MSATQSIDHKRFAKLAGVVLALHLVANAVHGVAHAELAVSVGPTLNAVIVLTAFVGPVVGVVLLWRGLVTVGAVLFGGSMAISFGLGLSLHFLLSNPDNVASVAAGPWQLPFQLTAAAIAAITAVGALMVAWRWWSAPDPGDTLPRSGRIQGVPDAGFRPLTRLTYWVSRRWFGEVPEPVTVAAQHRGILLGQGAFEAALDGADRVDEGLKQLATIRVAALVGCEFCLDIGAEEARARGVTDEQLRTLHDFEASDAFTERERLVLRYAEATTTTPAAVPDALFDQLAAEFTEAELVELTATIAFENYRARFNHALGIEAQGFAEGAFCPPPEARPVSRARGSWAQSADTAR